MAERILLGVPGAVALGHLRVLGAGERRAAGVDEQRAVRFVALRARRVRERDRGAEVDGVVGPHGSR